MKYYSSWQEAFMEFIKEHGDEYIDAYNLTMEFELKLHRNIRGAYYMRVI